MLDLQLEAFADAAGAILAQQRREWALEHAAFVAEHRAMMAELRRENAELRVALKAAVDEEIARVDAALANIKDGEPGPSGPPGPAGESIVGPRGERGVGIAAVVRDGTRLAFELDDERVFDVGDIAGERGEKGDVGPEGPAGRDGRDGLPGIPGAAGERGIDGKDGRDGVDGKDGLGVDELRSMLAVEVKEALATEWARAYRGVYREGEVYERGHLATWGGSLYHCNEPTTEKPGAGSAAWTLAVKRGQDGKDGKPGVKGDPGAPGRPGRDLTQVGPDGSKWG